MKKLIFLLSLLLVGTLSSEAQDQIPEIAILGTFHFGETTDMNAMKTDDLLSEKRQQEMVQLAEKLAAFKPTKIMIEWEPEHYDRINRELQQYLAGDFRLLNHEVYQIAFRVAEIAGVEEIIPVDYKMGLGDENLMGYLQKTGATEEFGKIMGQVQEYLQKETAYLKANTLTEFYRNSNSDSADRFSRNMYLEVLPALSKEPGNPLLAYAGNWYKRNIFIMGNIDSHLEPGDRVLFITGSAHRAILKDLYKGRDKVKYVEIAEYLD